jgi:uncharacterized NAD(P)/FAD-binding protein YdhS
VNATHIVIIGAGFSGTLACVHLLRRARELPGRAVHVTIVEREPRRFARGYAYSTPHHACLLNVPAGRMSAFDDRIDHFVAWARAREPAVAGGTFVPRAMYGRYLAWLLRDAQASLPANVTFEQLTGDAVSFDGSSVGLSNGRALRADRAVLALGNHAPRDPACADARVLAGDRYTRHPWEPDALVNVPRDGDVLLIGAGLTMFDVALVLRDAGHRGAMHAISRRGLVPQPHRASAAPPRQLPFPESMRMCGPTPAELLRALRREVRAASRRGDDWREVVTALRHDTPMLWRSLDARGRRQFLRHLQPFWDTHRHRAAPQTAARVHRLRDEGVLVVRAARLLRIEPDEPAASLRITLRPRGAPRVETLDVAHVINCTGPDPDLSYGGGGPLIADLIARQVATTDPLGLGLRTAPDGALLCPDGSASERLFTLGPPRRGDLWETTAVPELRVQAAQLAERLLE